MKQYRPHVCNSFVSFNERINQKSQFKDPLAYPMTARIVCKCMTSWQLSRLPAVQFYRSTPTYEA